MTPNQGTNTCSPNSNLEGLQFMQLSYMIYVDSSMYGSDGKWGLLDGVQLTHIGDVDNYSNIELNKYDSSGLILV